MDDFIKLGASLGSLIAVFWVAHVLVKNKRFSYLITRQGRFAALDGIRGYLALGVFFNHYVITWYWKNNGSWQSPPEHYIEMFGRVAVSIFFMITGFLFVSKIIRDKGSTNWLKLYESRVFRIYPLFIFALLLITAVVFVKVDFVVNASLVKYIKEYISWLLFLGATINNYSEATLIIAQVYWTLKYEWVFYLSLPLIALVLSTFRFSGGVLLMVVAIVGYIFPVKILNYVSTDLFILFAVGGFIAYLLEFANHLDSASQSGQDFSKKHLFKQKLLNQKIVQKLFSQAFCHSPLSSIIVLLSVAIAVFFSSLPHVFMVLLLFVAFFLLVFGNDIFGLLSSPASKLLGEISYSIYLLHGILLFVAFSLFDSWSPAGVDLNIFMLFMPLFSIVVVLFCSLTYYYIEHPGIEFGRRYYFSGKLSGLIRRKTEG